MTIIVLPNQSLLDVAIQHTGSVHNAFAIAYTNGLPVSETLTTGQILEIPLVENNTEVYNNYKKNKIKPATSFTDIENITERRGIGWMKVATTFKVD